MKASEDRLVAVRDQLEQGPVGIPEVDAGTVALCAAARDRPLLDLDAGAAQVLDGAADRAAPDEAEVGVARPDGIGGPRRRFGAGAADIQLLRAQTSGERSRGEPLDPRPQ